ncbi:YckD family protein [Thermoanaerobacter thermocopriae]|jgi:transcriptional regulator CtsR|uniref:YckD family protein n=1 Tax=Thermoanaerobacter thermocopriae TaxID=29350 RepID=UPI00048B5180|nr:YckD family protein [Thermoanaerobacter thermocopriae]
MKRNKWLIVLAVALALAIPLTVFAANIDSPLTNSIKGFLGIDTSKLTSEQKQIIADYNKKIADLEKEFINKLLSEGLITQQQADNIIKNIDSRVSEANQDNVPFFIGGGRGFDKGFFGIGRIDTSKLTEQQKAALTEIYKQMASLQKDIVNKLVSEGLLTQDQANKITSAIDNAIANADKKGYAMFGGKNGLGFILRGVDPSKLTDQQKNELINYYKQMAQLQKQLVDKFVSFGVITQDQGNTIKSRIDTMVKNMEQNGLPQGFFKHFEGKNGQTNTAPQGYSNSL